MYKRQVRAYNGGLGAEPLVRGLPPEAESILVIGCPTEPANLAPFQKYPFELRYVQQSLIENSMLCYGPLVSELGVPECMVPPTLSLGACAPTAPPPMDLLYFNCIIFTQVDPNSELSELSHVILDSRLR